MPDGVIPVLVVVGIVIVAFILFNLYYIFKQVQFVLVSVNLYKKMVLRQDAIIKLLADIRDNTKAFDLEALSDFDEEQEFEPELMDDDEVESEEDEEDEDSDSEDLSNDEKEFDQNFCFHCGEELHEKVARCPKCGKKL